jgi:hypothetical protein
MYCDFNELVGKVFCSVTKTIFSFYGDNDAIEFITEDGEKYWLTHSQSCCESVWIEDICGDLNDLVGTPILVADESSSVHQPPPPDREWDSSHTWTFFRLSTIKGSVQIRFYGTSNGCYSESANLIKGEEYV